MRAPNSQFWQMAVFGLLVVGLVLLALGGYLRPALSAAQSPLVDAQRWFSARFSAVRDLVTKPGDVVALQSENAQLRAEVANLQTQVIQLQQQVSEAQMLYALLDFARSRPQSEYAAAAMIGRDPNPFLHYVYIDQGSDQGLQHGMPVVTNQGLVGRVDAVTAQGGRVQLLTDPKSVVNVKLQSLKVDAQLVGSVTGELYLQMVPQDVPLKPGELILTSGLGGNYPPNILVGQVISVRKNENDVFQTATVQSAVDFRSLTAVLVITNFRPIDLAPLAP